MFLFLELCTFSTLFQWNIPELQLLVATRLSVDPTISRSVGVWNFKLRTKYIVEDEKHSKLSTNFCKPYVFYIVKYNGILCCVESRTDEQFRTMYLSYTWKIKNHCWPLNMMEAILVYRFFHDQILFLKRYADINLPAWTQILSLICHATSEEAHTYKCTTQAHTKMIHTQLCSKTPETIKFSKVIFINLNVSNRWKILFSHFLLYFLSISVFSFTCSPFLWRTVPWCVGEISATFQGDCFKFQTAKVWLLVLTL